MVTINKTIENLKPGKQYLVTVRPKDADLNLALSPVSAIRFTVPSDATRPADLGNLVIVGNYKSIMISFNPSNEADLSGYNYEVYLSENIALSGSMYVIVNNASPYISGFSGSNVIAIDVPQNSETTNNVNANTGVTTTTTTPKLYFGRVQSVDTTGNTSGWTPVVASTATTLIDSAHIIDLTASKITAGTIGAHTITMAGVNSILKSSNYQAANTTFGGTGWKISGDGKAVFNDASIRSSLDIGEDQGTSDATSFHVDANGNMWSGANSTSFAVAPFRVTNTGEVTARTLTLTGNTILSQTDDSKIYLGVGVYNNTNTPFYVDSDSQFSLGNKLTWDGSNLTVSGNINITGGNTLTLINNAESNAATAYTVALSAQSLALTANTNAGSAYTAALSAESLALTANTSASSAGTTAQNAYNTANTKITAGGAAFDINGNSTNISGDKIKTGQISSNNPGVSWINLDDGTFAFGSGKISWNGSTLSVAGDISGCSGTFTGALSGATISGGTVTGTSILGGSIAVEGGDIKCDYGTLRVGTNRGLQSDGTFSTTTSTTTCRVHAYGSYGSEVFREPASRRELKENIEDILGATAILKKLRPRIFNWKIDAHDPVDPTTGAPWTDDAKAINEFNKAFGFIAEEVAEDYPALALYSSPRHLPSEDPQSFFDIASWVPAMWKDMDMIPLLVKAIQELSAKVEELESKLS